MVRDRGLGKVVRDGKVGLGGSDQGEGWCDEGGLGEIGHALVRDGLALDLVAVPADARLAEDGGAPGLG